ncbi:MAG: hypothetical protein ACRELB_24385 [Polyangiaceae bacterium]
MVTLLTAVARHERRVRLVFDGALAAAAFTTAGLYSLAGGDGTTVPVAGLVGLVGMPNQLDLALGADLQVGGVYTVSASGVPAADGTTTPQGTTASVRLAAAPATPVDAEVTPQDITDLLYGVDLMWSGTDYVESSAGDLATVGGADNVQAALTRRMASEGLPWDDTYGAKPRRYIDGTPGALPALRGTLVAQALADDRVKTAGAALETVDPTTSQYDVTVTLIGDDQPLSVPGPSTS